MTREQCVSNGFRFRFSVSKHLELRSKMSGKVQVEAWHALVKIQRDISLYHTAACRRLKHLLVANTAFLHGTGAFQCFGHRQLPATAWALGKAAAAVPASATHSTAKAKVRLRTVTLYLMCQLAT